MKVVISGHKERFDLLYALIKKEYDAAQPFSNKAARLFANAMSLYTNLLIMPYYENNRRKQCL